MLANENSPCYKILLQVWLLCFVSFEILIGNVQMVYDDLAVIVHDRN